MNSVGVFGRGFDFDCLFGEESRFAAKWSISSMIVLTSNCDVFLDSFLLACSSAAPFTSFLFILWSLLLLSALLAASATWLSSSPLSSMEQKPWTDLELSDCWQMALLSESSLTVVRGLFWETCNTNHHSLVTVQAVQSRPVPPTFLMAAGDLGRGTTSTLDTSRCFWARLVLRLVLALLGLESST